MPEMASEGEAVGGGESWFALKKDEFYVILDSVLTEMTKCDERNNVSGCIELIKLLSDNGTTSTANDKLPTSDGRADTKPSDRPNANPSGYNSSGCIGTSGDDRNGKRSNSYKPPVSCRANSGRRFSDNTQQGFRNGVDCRRHLNKGNHLPSATCVARRPPGIRDKPASRLQRPGVTFSKDVSNGRKTSLIGKTRDVVKASLFHPNRIVGTNHGLQNIYSNSTCGTEQNGVNAKLSTVSALRHQRQLAKNHQNKSKLPSSGLYHDTRVSSNRSEYHRQQSSHKQPYPGLCAKLKAHSFDSNPAESSMRHTSASNTTEDPNSRSETNIVDHRHITDTQLELRNLTPFKLTPTVDRQFFGTTPKAPKSKWTPVDKAVINNILDDILSGEDSHSPFQTDLHASRNSNCDVDTRNDDVNRTSDVGFVLQNDVKVEDQSDLKTDDDMISANLGNSGGGGVIANVKLVDVRRFDVSQMSFKWKSQLLWRMRHDKVSPTPLSSLCLT